MNPETELQLPPLVSTPTDQHAQVMYALGQITAEMRGLKEAKVVQNGRVDKLEIQMSGVKDWQSKNDGVKQGISSVWAVIIGLSGVAVGALAIYTLFHR